MRVAAVLKLITVAIQSSFVETQSHSMRILVTKLDTRETIEVHSPSAEQKPRVSIPDAHLARSSISLHVSEDIFRRRGVDEAGDLFDQCPINTPGSHVVMQNIGGSPPWV
jgi:hypothetical protein